MTARAAARLLHEGDRGDLVPGCGSVGAALLMVAVLVPIRAVRRRSIGRLVLILPGMLRAVTVGPPLLAVALLLALPRRAAIVAMGTPLALSRLRAAAGAPV